MQNNHNCVMMLYLADDQIYKVVRMFVIRCRPEFIHFRDREIVEPLVINAQLLLFKKCLISVSLIALLSFIAGAFGLG